MFKMTSCFKTDFSLLIVQQCQKALNISTWHAVGLYWVPGHAGVQGNTIADRFTRGGSALKFTGPAPALGVSRQDIRRIRHWLVKQHWIWWQGLGDTQRKARELILGPCLGAKARFLSFNRTQSRAVTGLLTGRNTPRRHLHLLGLLDVPLCRCGVEEETRPSFFVSVKLWLHWHVYMGSFLEPEGIKSISLGAIWNFNKVTGLPKIDMGRTGPVN
jgi:hypothetical protein